MLSHSYSYQQCLDNSLKVYWDANAVLEGKNFDFSKPFMPEVMVGTAHLPFLDDKEKLKLNHISANAYFHQAQSIEESIIAVIMHTAMSDVTGDEVKLRSLLRLCEEEVKHQWLFQNACKLITEGFGVECGLAPGKEQMAKAMLEMPRLAAMLLIEMIEWVTQAHYLEQVRDASDLDPLFSEILRLHWLEEAQHTKLDILLMDEMAAGMSPEEREAAVDCFLGLLDGFEGSIEQQTALNIETLSRATGRTFSAQETQAMTAVGNATVLFGLLGLGLQHPKFVDTVAGLTEAGAAKIAARAQKYIPRPVAG